MHVAWTCNANYGELHEHPTTGSVKLGWEFAMFDLRISAVSLTVRSWPLPLLTPDSLNFELWTICQNLRVSLISKSSACSTSEVMPLTRDPPQDPADYLQNMSPWKRGKLNATSKTIRSSQIITDPFTKIICYQRYKVAAKVVSAIFGF